MTRVSDAGRAVPSAPPADAGLHGQLLTTAQVASRVQLSIPLVRKAIREGRLQASLPGGRKHGYRIAPAAVDEWVASSAVIPRPPT
jgi:excisionase family DNA binding protein